MARKRKSSGKSSKCPEPLNTMIDLAAGLTMGVVAAHMEDKYHYKKKGKINPYSATAIGFATGSIKTTKDLLRTGAILGALGSFDVDEGDVVEYRSYTPEDPVFRRIQKPKTNDNRYAWRLNKQVGEKYGISPYDYETPEEYFKAIEEAKDVGIHHSNNGHNLPETLVEDSCVDPSTNEYIFVRVSRLDNGLNEYYLADDNNIAIGDVVKVPTDKGPAAGVILLVQKGSAATAPCPIEALKRLLK